MLQVVGKSVVVIAVVVGGLVATGAAPSAAAPLPLATKARVHVTISPSQSVPPGARTALTGRVTPAVPGRRVQLQALIGASWTRVATAKLSQRSAYTFRRSFRTPGVARLRVVLPAGGGHRAGVSHTRTVRVVPPGFDVSYPQCGAALPPGATFGVVGVDGGKPYDVNPCLAQQIAWALPTGAPAYYVNTAAPGPRLSSHWPSGQRSPRKCARAYPANDSVDCAFDYGFDAAANSYARAVAAAGAVGAPAVRTATWWLDVEMSNTWEALEYGHPARRHAIDLPALKGMARFLHSRGVHTVGVYSTHHQWQQITGGARWRAAPVWYAGVGSATGALAHCAASFTGGRVRMAQYAAGGFDADHRC